MFGDTAFAEDVGSEKSAPDTVSSVATTTRRAVRNDERDMNPSPRPGPPHRIEVPPDGPLGRVTSGVILPASGRLAQDRNREIPPTPPSPRGRRRRAGAARTR